MPRQRRFRLGAQDHAIHGTCSVFVASHYGVAGDMGRGQYDLSRDVSRCEVERSLQGSTAQMTILPNRPYTSWVFPGDWISIYMATNADDPEDYGVTTNPVLRSVPGSNFRIFFGFVRSIKEDSVTNPQTGATQVRYNISCTGAQSSFESTNVYFNRSLSSKTKFGGYLPGMSRLSYGAPMAGTPTTLPRGLAMSYMGFGEQFLMPTHYPQGTLGDEAERRRRVRRMFSVAKEIEEYFGFWNVRGTGETSKPTALGTSLRYLREELLSQSILSMMDLFSYTEDLFVDGALNDGSFHEQAGTVWSIMFENCNPIINEMWVGLLPQRDNATGERIFGGNVDEWGQAPNLVPSLIVRERPFSWRNEFYMLPVALRANASIAKRRIFLGDVFFSRRGQPGGTQYEKISPAGDVFPLIDEVTGGLAVQSPLGSGIRGVDRFRCPVQYIQRESLGLSDNDMFNFFMITQTKTPLTQPMQKLAALHDGLIPMFYPESIKRHGLRVREMATQFMYTGRGGISTSRGMNFVLRCLLLNDVWYQNSPWYRRGSLVVRPCPGVREGMMLDIEGPGREESFYIEAVNYSYASSESGSSGGTCAMGMTVTRGQPGLSNPELRFPYAAPDSVDIYLRDAVTGKLGSKVERPLSPVQPKVEQSPYSSDAARIKKFKSLAETWIDKGDIPISTGVGFLLDLQTTTTMEQAYETLRTLPTPSGMDPQEWITVSRKLEAEAQGALRVRVEQIPPVPATLDRISAGTAPWGRRKWHYRLYTGARTLWDKFRESRVGQWMTNRFGI